jgi:hypothetical protein
MHAPLSNILLIIAQIFLDVVKAEVEAESYVH